MSEFFRVRHPLVRMEKHRYLPENNTIAESHSGYECTTFQSQLALKKPELYSLPPGARVIICFGVVETLFPSETLKPGKFPSFGACD